MYRNTVKLVIIDLLEFIAISIGILFYIHKMVPFVTAALSLGYIIGQTISYCAYAILLIAFPIVLLLRLNNNKGTILRYVLYAHALVLIIGSICDITRYDWFTNYTFIEGDAVFVNLMWNLPNQLGLVISGVTALLYILLGRQIKRTRIRSYIYYVLIFISSHLPAYVYSFITTGGAPRITYLQKSLYIIVVQLLILIALSIAATSRSVWRRCIWS